MGFGELIVTSSDKNNIASFAYGVCEPVVAHTCCQGRLEPREGAPLLCDSRDDNRGSETIGGLDLIRDIGLCRLVECD